MSEWMSENTAFRSRCAVTMFDMYVALMRDGRERGLWVFLDDHSPERAQAYEQWVESAAQMATQFMGMSADGMKKFSAWMTLNGELKRLTNAQVEHGALMEWPEALKFYEAMGVEIDKARARGDLPKLKKPKKQTKAKSKKRKK